ncbi:hypothetical protein FisN_32Lh061 [Fistulifera solaris]|uniref:Uncharacterized protein n=1 Tax=Fistulifera solaris TaxID=1519565 RepID=A0A1Z5JFX2_FISSO|nr:hypothetical protein FisN_32Lh061 [Fistulifera solaris]|eukprot:GAX12917.1 hypothetical protein FisN_32Lh061 [Fistulifera solaris]
MNPSVELPEWVSLSKNLPLDRTTKRCKRIEDGMQQLSLEHQTLPSFLFEHRQEDVHTCLIRILSVGNVQDDAQQLEWMHRHVQQTLASCTNLAPTLSRRSTTALHVAIRNYGSFRPLLQTLIEADPTMLSVFDDTGETPIHTACRLGIPLQSLQLLLSHMTPSKASLLGAPNHRGWTPFDLAWIRYLEMDDIGTLLQRHDIGGGNSLANQRLSQLFAKLLTETVDHILQSEHRDSAMKAVAPMMNVISCLLEASVTHPDEESTQYRIHQAFQVVSCWDGLPLIPLPILQLLLVQYPHQVEWADQHGKLPLHYAVSIRPRPTKHERSIPPAELRRYVQDVLNQYPQACLVKDAVGRLPIHYCLENRNNETCDNCVDWIVKDVMLACPAAIEIVDPVSCLYPFMMAATDSNLSLELLYMMLRFHPQCLPSSVH